MKRSILGLLVAFCALLSLGSFQSSKTAKNHDDLIEQMIDGTQVQDSALKKQNYTLSGKNDEYLLKLYNEKYIEYEMNVLELNKRAFNWQHASSIIIFIISVLITLFGLIFSAIHFLITTKNISLSSASQQDMTKMITNTSSANTVTGTNDLVDQLDSSVKNKDEADKKVKDTGSGVTSIEVSATGIKMSSSILGVIILIISLLFFFMYVKFVYPINKI
ncbi:hypothetical protein [Hymenobacter sublimis]|uniref:CcmD family protein n=1 Tax=Hymenobacter sublimis TaxID=2933777 RepID=A0ABY4JCM8_9BACT|nr:hypothetical protein [Hymenobacter sublimis]UPL50548.1 hypothetical protein MWH26_06475 [Hymenobacter sublimis]